MSYQRTPLSDEQKAELREQAITRLRRQLHHLDERFDKIPRDRRDQYSPMVTGGDIDAFNDCLELLMAADVDTAGWWVPKEGGRTHNKGRRSEFQSYDAGSLQLHIERVLGELVPGFTEERNEVRTRIWRGEPRIAPATGSMLTADDAEGPADTEPRLPSGQGPWRRSGRTPISTPIH